MASDVTRLSSRGQVVIPAAIRRRLRLTTGEPLLVETGPPGERMIILRGQSRDEVRERLARAYSWFERTGRDLVEELSSRSRGVARRRRLVVKARKRGIGRNPRTGEVVRIAPGRTVRFKPGKLLRDLPPAG